MSPTGAPGRARVASEATVWLAGRLEGVPGELASEMRLLVEEVAGCAAPDVPRLLAAAGLRGLDAVSEEDSGRESALRLLAADALLTVAFEAAADLGLDVGVLADEVGPKGALGRSLSSGGGRRPAAEPGAGE